MANKISKKLYNGTIGIEFYPDSHRYKKEGEKTYLISVTAATGIIDKSRFLIPWAVNLDFAHLRQFLESMTGHTLSPEEIYPVIDEACKQHTIRKEEAADIGSVVHDFAENFAKFKTGQVAICPEITDDLPEGAINGINAFLDWFNSNDVEFLNAEQLLYSKEHDYAGLADAVAKVNGKHLLIDYKTGKAIYNEAHYQVAGYVMAHEEEFKTELDGALILNFDKETGLLKDVQEIGRDDIEKNKETFLNCLGVKRREKELNKAYYAKPLEA